MKRIFLYGGVALSLALANSCARNPVTGKKQVVFTSEASEIQQGAAADPEVVAQFGLYPDSALQRYFREHGLALAAQSHRPGLQWSYKILDSDVINAFATPGGYVYFTRGIMAYFNDEAQMEGVLGHETGHVTARHSVIQQRNQILGQAGVLATVIVNPNLGQVAQTASQGLGLLMLKFSRDDERQADELGVEYSTKMGYDAKHMAAFFQTLQRETQSHGGSTLPPFLSTHPDPGDRFVTVSQLAEQWQQKTGKTSGLLVNRDSYLRRIEGITYGADPRQGFVEAGAFYHPDLKFQFPVPSGWQTQNTPAQFQMAPQDGSALMVLTLAPGNDLNTAATQQLQKFGLESRESRSSTVNGNPALIVVADQAAQASQGGQTGAVTRTLNYFIQYGGAIYHLIGATSSQNFATYQSTFTNVMEGFRQLTDPNKLNRKPERVRLRTVGSATTLRQALTGFGVPQARLEELAILNGMQLTDNLAAGTLIKTVGQ
ncbi:peptidase M48 [Flaviaesturariibacter flavus]|uniref:Peptidase M48 n=1 Tax=Flaviaesturariibacter flavus TaxID=2502780 RepID=A0A4R1BN23_9BACT|nr:M48 family metalloprotease [Flaviaesturariibacter flavus]TCJ18960.1 peptidase M48 [Flaviaesturariibacter flavus]